MNRHTLYIDESGTHGFTDNRVPRSKHFLITGVSVKSGDDSNLSGYFEYLKRKHGIDPGTAFHAYSIFEDKKTRLAPSKASSLVKALADFIEVAPINYSVYFLNKNECREFFKIPKNLKNASYVNNEYGSLARDIAYDILASRAFWWFSGDMIQDKEKGAIIAESRQHSDLSLLESFLICKDPDMFIPRPIGNPGYRSCDVALQVSARKMQQRVTSLKLENKIGECPGLELADLISYITFLKLENRLSEFESRNLSLLWRAIKKNMETRNPIQISGSAFEESLPRNRVHKISKFVKSL